jgi:hypothetical protein
MQQSERYNTPKTNVLLIMLGTLFVASTQIGCGVAGFVVNADEKAAVDRFRSGEYELIKIDILAKLKEEAALGRSVGRYQQYSRGPRTWRLDSATGATCLLLTTDLDWKNPSTMAAACKQEKRWLVELERELNQ